MMKKVRNLRFLFLVTMSFIFYGFWKWKYLYLILASGFLDYFMALAMARRPAQKKLFLIISIVGNVGSLALFKYNNFFLSNVNWIGSHFQGFESVPYVHWALPVGISFFTFQSMSYTIDVYRGHLQPTKNPLHFFSYLALFPQLVAGPIERASELLPQLNEVKAVSTKKQWQGFELIVLGYFKKVVIADNLAPTVNQAWNSPTVPHCSGFWWLIMLMFAYQIYCDFSGYTDIARGLAKWMGYEFSKNFNHPYIAKSMQEFWGRWHISLSTWFRDYVYIPLGGSRRGPLLSMRNLWITMLLSGLWHGGHWAFLVWGAVHALCLTLEKLTHWPKKLLRLPGGGQLATLVTFVLVLVAWVFFRAGCIETSLVPEGGLVRAQAVLSAMFDFTSHDRSAFRNLGQNSMLWILLGIIFVRQLYFLYGYDQKPRRLPPRVRAVADRLLLIILLLACIYLRGPGNAFIYFQF